MIRAFETPIALDVRDCTLTDIDNWLSDVHPRHVRLSKKVAEILEEMIHDAGIEFLDVTHRTKPIKDIKKKIARKEYGDPRSQLTDISGLRVVTYFESQVIAISKIVNDIFKVDNENSLDKSTLLGPDRIGYRSVHFVCEIGDERARIREYESFHGLKFEIQVRTVLQHAWAELAHDRNYKLSIALPAGIQRQLNLYAGLLEVADRGIDQLITEIDEYCRDIKNRPVESLLDTDVNSISIAQYLEAISPRFAFPIEKQAPGELSDLILEVKRCAISNLGELDSVFSKEFVAAANENYHQSNYMGLTRGALMYEDIKRYFEKAWCNDWQVIGSQSKQLLV